MCGSDLHSVGVLLQLVVDLRCQEERLRLLKAVTDSNRTEQLFMTRVTDSRLNYFHFSLWNTMCWFFYTNKPLNLLWVRKKQHTELQPEEPHHLQNTVYSAWSSSHLKLYFKRCHLLTTGLYLRFLTTNNTFGITHDLVDTEWNIHIQDSVFLWLHHSIKWKYFPCLCIIFFLIQFNIFI